MNNDFSFSELVRIIQKQFKFIAGIGVLALILSAIFSSSFFIAPRFKSTAIVYPSNITAYSEESRTEQLLQMFEASNIRDSIILKYNLAELYDIDTNSLGWRYAVVNEYASRFTIKKTRFEAVEISVEDEDPKRAYDMVNEMMVQLNLKARNVQRLKSEEIVAMSKRQLDEQVARIDSLNERLNTLRKDKGIIEYELQTQEATKGLYRLSAEGKSGSKDYQDAQATLTNLKEFGGEFKALYEQQEAANSYYTKLMEAHQTALNDIRKELSYLNTVVYPEVADKKSYPVRWLIVFTSVFSAILFAVVMFLFLEGRSFGSTNKA